MEGRKEGKGRKGTEGTEGRGSGSDGRKKNSGFRYTNI
jgi:hypothetical protein